MTPSDAEFVDFPRKIVAAAALICRRTRTAPDREAGLSRKLEHARRRGRRERVARRRRELLEELALDLEVGRLLALDWRPDRGQGDSLQFIFEGVTLNSTQLARLRIPEDEISEYRFLPVEEAIATLPERMRPRVAAAVRSLDRGVPIYLESGIEPGD